MKTTASATLPTDALAALRDATRTRHDRIDALIAVPRMAEAGRYTRVLQAFDAFLAPWEAGVAQALPAGFGHWLRERSRRPFLAADLRALGLPRLQPAAVPELGEAAAAWGSLYVIEGSALGGQVIARTLANGGLPTAYFQGWGAATGAMWREFRGLLAEQVSRPAEVDAACHGARATFDALTSFFETHLHERTATA